MEKWLFGCGLCLLLACRPPQEPVIRPAVFTFGSSQAAMLEVMTPLCSAIEARTIEPRQLPTAQRIQTQLDCTDFRYAGKAREAELVFADDQLDLVWILTEPEEERFFIQQFTERFGSPTHVLPDATFFLDDGVAVRNDPHEVLFLSDRLREPYRQWLASQAD